MGDRMRCGKIIWLALIGGMLLLGVSAFAGQMRLPADLVYSKADGSPGKVVFSHEFHVALSEKCTTCHGALFRMLHPTRTVTHPDMEAGRSCGACHNGSMAFGPRDPATCDRCHGVRGKS